MTGPTTRAPAGNGAAGPEPVARPDVDLGGRTVVLTGAGRGIGAATVRRALDAGASVVALVQAGGQHSLADVADHDRLLVHPVDVRDGAAVLDVVRRVEDRFGDVDALVNNAGVIEPIGLLGDVDPDGWADVLAVNAVAPMRYLQAFLPGLLRRRGTVVNMASGAAYRPLEGWSAYCTSKSALVMLSRAADLEYRDSGLRTFALGLPPTDTAMQGSVRASGINEISRVPQGNLTPPTTVAAAVAWLCGPEARGLDRVEIDVRDPLFAAITGEVA